MNMYCVKCKLKTESKNITEVLSKNGRKMLKSICSICNCKKSSFTKSQTKTGKGIGDTIIKTINKIGELHLPAEKGEYSIYNIMYCVKCKLKTESKNITEVTALNGRKMLKSICSLCNCKKS